MADDNEFFDIMYQQWSKTTGAEHTYWMPVESSVQTMVGEEFLDYKQFDIVAVKQTDGGEERTEVAGFLREEDADFLCGIHGALPDLVRRLHDAVDEAESKDAARDRAEAVSAELALENIALREQVRELERELEARH